MCTITRVKIRRSFKSSGNIDAALLIDEYGIAIIILVSCIRGSDASSPQLVAIIIKLTDKYIVAAIGYKLYRAWPGAKYCSICKASGQINITILIQCKIEWDIS